MIATRCRALLVSLPLLLGSALLAQTTESGYHGAPPSARQMDNPLAGQESAALAGERVYASHCASCHGPHGQGSGNIPPLTTEPVKAAADGELFWYITRGDLSNGMPSWVSLPEQQRWQIVTLLKSSRLSSMTVAPPAQNSASAEPAI